MFIKKGVSLKGLRPEMVCALVMVSDATLGDFTVTGGTEDHPDRLPDSLHRIGLAIDIRVPEDKAPTSFRELDEWHSSSGFKRRIARAFEDTEYDVVWYDSHVHIEFDPK